VSTGNPGNAGRRSRVAPTPVNEGLALRVEGVHKAFGKLEVLRGIDLDVSDHAVVCLIGASGSGKSTLLRCINLLEPIQAGRIIVGGVEITARNVDLNAIRRRIGIVFQSFNLFPHMSVLENVTLAPRKALKQSRGEADAHATVLLERFGLADKRDEYPDRLSGGQQQRVAIARALVGEPVIILGDEPTGNLDTRTSEEIMVMFQELHAEGKTVVMVTHEEDIANHAQRVVRFRDGHIVSDQPVENCTNARKALAALPVEEEE